MSTPEDFAVAVSRLSLVSETQHDLGPRQLSPGEFRTLRQLERRLRTGQLDAVNIRDVQQLAALGLAHHDRGGWRPTKDGLNYLDQQPSQGLSDEEAATT